ncbi:PrsW family intramembrane metalloprotease [Candidatus Fermentibacteria bacterium]|nr:MAG: PrsW family intramembrane metalloprotease [Candidatus Fermentibacteria bacterium]
MRYLAVALVSVIPALGWLWYFYRTDKYEPEPTKLVFRTFFLGALFAVALGTSYGGLPFPWGPAKYSAVIWAPLVEETGKFLIVFWTVFRNRNFNEPFDGVVYGASAALGFAACENAFYVISGWETAGAGAGTLTLLARSVFSVPGHALFASFWGAALGYSKGRKGLRPVLVTVAGLLLGMVCHGLFNWLSMENVLRGLGFVVFMGLLWRLVYVKIFTPLLNASPYRRDEPEKS